MSKFQGTNVQHSDYSLYCTVSLKVAVRVEFQYSNQSNNKMAIM